MKRFKPVSRDRDQKPGAEEPTSNEVEKEPTEPVATADDAEEEDYRLIAVDNTPFFTRLRSGLRSKAKPSRYLDKGMRVKLLEENEEKLFSRIQLPDRKKGWVPSRLVRQQAPDDAAIANEGRSPVPPPEGPDESELFAAPEPPTLPAEEISEMGPLDDSQLAPVIIPEVGIELPTSTPTPPPIDSAGE